MAHRGAQVPTGRSTLRDHLHLHRRQQPSISSAASAHLRHLHQVATWASTAVPPLGAFLGYRLASMSELFGCPVPQNTCERCESILQVGVNCSVRIRTRNSKKRRVASKEVSTPINNVIYTCQYCAFERNSTGTPKHYVKTKLHEVAARCEPSEKPHQSLNDSMQGNASNVSKSNNIESLSSSKGVSLKISGKKAKRKGWLSLKQLAGSSADLSPAVSSRPTFSLGSATLSHSGPTVNASLLGMKADRNATTYSSSIKAIVEGYTPLMIKNDTKRAGEKVSDCFVDEREMCIKKKAAVEPNTVKAVVSMRRPGSDDDIRCKVMEEESMYKPGMKADGNATAKSRSFIKNVDADVPLTAKNAAQHVDIKVLDGLLNATTKSRSFITIVDTDVPSMVKNVAEHVDEKVLDGPFNKMELIREEIKIAALSKKKPGDDDDGGGGCKVVRDEQVCIPETERVGMDQMDRKEANGLMASEHVEQICRNMNSQKRKVKSRTEKKILKVKSRTKKRPFFRRLGRHWLTCRKSKSPFEWRII